MSVPVISGSQNFVSQNTPLLKWPTTAGDTEPTGANDLIDHDTDHTRASRKNLFRRQRMALSKSLSALPSQRPPENATTR